MQRHISAFGLLSPASIAIEQRESEERKVREQLVRDFHNKIFELSQKYIDAEPWYLLGRAPEVIRRTEENVYASRATVELTEANTIWRVLSPDVIVDGQCAHPQVRYWSRSSGICHSATSTRFVVVVPTHFQGIFNSLLLRTSLCLQQLQYHKEVLAMANNGREKQQQKLFQLICALTDEYTRSPWERQSLLVALINGERYLVERGELLWSTYATAEWVGRLCDDSDGYIDPSMRAFGYNFASLMNFVVKPLFFWRLYSPEKQVQAQLTPRYAISGAPPMKCAGEKCPRPKDVVDDFELLIGQAVFVQFGNVFHACHIDCCGIPPKPEIENDEQGTYTLEAICFIWHYLYVRHRRHTCSDHDRVFFVVFCDKLLDKWPQACLPSIIMQTYNKERLWIARKQSAKYIQRAYEQAFRETCPSKTSDFRSKDMLKG